MSEMAKVVLIGVYGATFGLIRPWMTNGDLPNFSAFADGGVEGVLESLIPIDLDGSVLTEVLDGGVAERLVEQQSPTQYGSTQTAESGACDDVEDRLEDLGYF